MIPQEVVTAFVAQLAEYVDERADLIMLRWSERGHVEPDALTRSVDMLNRNDPTGFASAFLLDEAIQSVFAAGKVNLGRVLNEEGYIERLALLSRIRQQLSEYLAKPRDEFIARVTKSVAEIGLPTDEITSRSVAVCLRDAVYAMDSGLSQRWLRCDAGDNSAPGKRPLPLSRFVLEFDTLPDFVAALRSNLGAGAYLACVDSDLTVIGLKLPGRVMYLSSLEIDARSGGLRQIVGDKYGTAKFDINKPLERYPDWDAIRKGAKRVPAACRPEVGEAQVVCPLSNLPADQVLWLALVVEMARQAMVRAEPGTVDLAESMMKALQAGNPENLPAHQVNFDLTMPSIEAVFSGLELDEWTRRFMRPALERLTAEHFLPVGDARFALELDTGALWTSEEVAARSDELDSRFVADFVDVCPVSPQLVGTRAEMDAARHRIFERNLLVYLLAWTNTRIAKLWGHRCAMLWCGFLRRWSSSVCDRAHLTPSRCSTFAIKVQGTLPISRGAISTRRKSQRTSQCWTCSPA
jgi:hypothetical protein